MSEKDENIDYKKAFEFTVRLLMCYTIGTDTIDKKDKAVSKGCLRVMENEILRKIRFDDD
jgi:hypothetical protein